MFWKAKIHFAPISATVWSVHSDFARIILTWVPNRLRFGWVFIELDFPYTAKFFVFGIFSALNESHEKEIYVFVFLKIAIMQAPIGLLIDHIETKPAGIAGLNGPLPSAAPQVSRKKGVAEAQGPESPQQTCWIFYEISKMVGEGHPGLRPRWPPHFSVHISVHFFGWLQNAPFFSGDE